MAIQKISNAVIADNAIDSDNLASGAVNAADITDGTITTAKLADDSITNAKIAPNSVTSTEIAAGSVTYNQIQDGTIITSKIADSQITPTKIDSTGNYTVGNITSKDYILQGISTDILDTAVDIFIYDTSKDSDGGEWRNNTQDTSWYNETLNTATRGSRREFPAIAVIVLEVDRVTIYDGDDTSMPMWMTWEGNEVAGSAGSLIYEPAPGDCSLSSICMMNGIMVYTDGGNAAGTYEVNFIKDSASRFGSAGEDIWQGTIADRQLSLFKNTFNGPRGGILNWYSNDSSITVLPNAPIDDATGLPIPTIAVATDGGISIIENNTVFSSASNTSYPIYEVEILPTGELFHRQGSGNNEGVNYNNPYTRINGVDLGTYANSSTFWYANDGVGNSSSILGRNTVAPIAIKATDKESFHVGDTLGLSNISVNRTDLNSGMSNWVTTSYNTGWMVGDIKLATLSDTDATNVTGTELLPNGTLDDATGWSFSGSGEYTITGGQLVDSATLGHSFYSPYATVEVGKTYVASFYANGSGGSPTVRISDGTTNLTSLIVNDGNRYYSMTFTPTSGQTSVRFDGSGQAWTGYYDNFSIRLAEKDRSVNGKGLQVFGTVTKTPVATGADLVAYGGFSANNYIVQPYNPGLDYSGDFCWNFWYYHVDVATNEYIVFRAPPENGTPKTEIYVNPGNQIGCYISDMGGINVNNLQENVWHHVCVVRDSGTVRFYVNGVQRVTGSSSVNLTNTSAVLAIGKRLAGTYNGINGKLALFRTSATAPSAEQISKIYEDEKFLFQEGAQATLYGSSNAVTALAYDDDTELLHVGTSAGRSVFQGLRRVQNTTTAVTTAISANNELVAEQ